MTPELALAIVKGKIADYAIMCARNQGISEIELAAVLREIADEFGKGKPV